MSDRSRTKYIILGMLSIEPSSAYDIMQKIKSSTNYFWSESEGQIYPTLAKCVRDELATCVKDSQNNGRLKKIYTITTKGRELLIEWLEKSPQDASVRNEFLLKLFFARNISTDTTILHLENFINKRQEELQSFKNINKELLLNHDLHKPFWLATLKYGIENTKSELEWAKSTLKSFKLLK